MEYMVKWKDKRFDVEHFIVVRDYGAKVLVELLKENGYDFSWKEIPEPSKEYSEDFKEFCKQKYKEMKGEKNETDKLS